MRPLTTVHTAEELNAAIDAFPPNLPRNFDVGFVPTMGALHPGHLNLVKNSVADNDVTIVSIFVNPLQFSPDEDFSCYPRTLSDDQKLLQDTSADILFVPKISTMYPGLTAHRDAPAPGVTVQAGPLGDRFEGAARPGHFNGVLTAVAKLFHLCRPHGAQNFTAYFGQKDAQQARLVQMMIHDLNFPVKLKVLDTVRSPLPRHVIERYPSPREAYEEIPGLALSSRNKYLSATEREAALVIARVLKSIASSYHDNNSIELSAALDLISYEKLVHLDYCEVVDAATFTPLPRTHGGAIVDREAVAAHAYDGILAIIAAYLGKTRLIDNLWILKPSY